MVFYNHPYTENKKQTPIYIGKDKIEYIVYPKDGLDYSDVCAMYLSTEEITVCVMEIGPGGMFDPPDCHPGDEAYYILEGSITLLNPATGQCVEVNEGEAALIPKGALHSGYNFSDKAVKVLAVIAPKVHEAPDTKTDVNGPKKIFNYRQEDFPDKSAAFHACQKLGTIDDIGAWPEDGGTLRGNGIIYPVSEEKKLRVIHGNTRPMLMKLAISNDFMHVGEFILPIGGQVASHSESLSHGGQSLLFGLDGEITVLFATGEAYKIGRYEALYVPSDTEYQLINYGNKLAKIIFASTKIIKRYNNQHISSQRRRLFPRRPRVKAKSIRGNRCVR